MVQGIFMQEIQKIRTGQHKTLSRWNREMSRLRGKFSDFIYLLFL